MADLYHTEPPATVPEPGYYYHYKHDPDEGVNHYAYYIYGVGNFTEELPEGMGHIQHQIVYRPLYASFVYEHGKMFDLRPLAMFWQPPKPEDLTLARFTRITDAAVIIGLQKIRRQMYRQELLDWG